MTLSAPSPSTSDPESDRREAIAFMLEAFDAGREAGIENHALSRAALFQSIMRIVEELGEEDAARFLRTSAKGVQSGYYTRGDVLN
ncbi:hypothetical protein ABWH92_00080 [Ahrensia marina]|uniref:hypothetical protein n=1 Tax=Ahrensia marina TaxID=1514904 RepID=UPI0035D0655D